MPTITDLQDEVKRHKLFVDWIETMVGFFKRESAPRSLLDYRRGQVIWVDFGFNVGSNLEVTIRQLSWSTLLPTTKRFWCSR